MMVFTATLGFEEGFILALYDDANAFYNICHHSFLPALAEIVLSVTLYAANLYARELPKVMFASERGDLKMVESAWRVQQECNLSPLCYSTGSL